MSKASIKIELLVSAVDLTDVRHLPTPVQQATETGLHVLTINQTRDLPGPKSPVQNLRILSYDERGISRSRNRALESCSGELLLFCDEDVELLEGFDSVIIDAFDKNPEADLITFQSLNQNGELRKNYKDREFWHDLRTAMRVSSIEMAIRRRSFEKESLRFDARFGIGSLIPTGSETVFLSLALSKGLKIRYCPKPIVKHHDASSGRDLYLNDSLIKAKGAMFYRIFGSKAYGISLLFAFKKRKETGLSTWQGYRLMLRGIKEFKTLDDET